MSIIPLIKDYLSPNKNYIKKASYWHDKYITLLDNNPNPVIEVIKNEIIYFNKAAQVLLNLEKKQKTYILNNLFHECREIKSFSQIYKKISTISTIKNNRTFCLIVTPLPIRENYCLELNTVPYHAEKIKKPSVSILDNTLTDLFFSRLSDGFVRTNHSGDILFANKVFCSMIGYTADELRSKNFLELTPKKWHYNEIEILSTNKKSDDICVYEKKLTHKNGDVIPVEVQAYFYKSKKEKGYRNIVRNISQLKTIRESFLKSEEFYREIFDSSFNAIFIHDYKTGKLLDVNQTVLDTYGYTKKEMLSLNIEDFSAGSTPYSQKEADQLLLRVKKKKNINFIWHDRRKNGDYFWSENYIKTAQIHGKKYILVFSKDITNQKHVQDEISEIKQLLEGAIGQLPAGVLIVRASDEIIMYNNLTPLSLPPFFNKIKADTLSKYQTCLKLSGSDNNENELLITPLSLAIKKGVSISDFEFKLSGKKGESFWLTSNASPIKNENGDIIAGIVLINNITDKKNAEKEIVNSKLVTETILNTIPVRVFWKDLSLKYLGCNKKFLEDAGLKTYDQILGKIDYQLSWSQQAYIYQKDDMEVIKSGKAKIGYEEPQTTPEGELIWLKTNKVPLKNDQNEIIGVLGTYDNITEIKNNLLELEKHRSHLELLVKDRTIEIEQINKTLNSKNIELEKYKNHLEKLVADRTFALERSEAHMKLIMQSVPLAYYSYYRNNRKDTLWYSDQIISLTGFKKQELIDDPKLWESRIKRTDYELVRGTFDNIQLDIPLSCEYRWRDSSDNDIWIYDQAILIKESDNQPEQIIGCFLDITDRKLSEHAIIESEKNYREIFNSSSDAIFVIDCKDGHIVDVNSTALNIFGGTHEDTLNAKLEDFSSDEAPYSNKLILNHIDIVRKRGTHRFEWISQRKNKTQFWSEITLKLITISGEEKILSVIRDINDEKIAETQIQYRHNFEKLIFDISSRFINIPFDEVDQSLILALKEICEFTDSDAAYLVRYKSGSFPALTHNWQKDFIMQNPLKLHESDSLSIQWHTNQMRADKVIKISCLDTIPLEAIALRTLLEEQNIKSFVDVPLIYQGEAIGYFGIASSISEREWLEDSIALLKVIGQSFINALKRKESVESLLISEQSHREIYNSITEAILVYDFVKKQCIDTNKAMLDIFGYTSSEILELDILKLSSGIEPYTMENAIKLIQNISETENQVFEWNVKRKDGNSFWVEVSAKKTELKGLKCLLFVARDITEKRNAQEILIQNEEKYRLLVEGQTDLIIKVDTEERFLFVSPSYCEFFGKTEEELLNKKYLPLIHEEDLTATSQAMKNLNFPPYSCYLEQRALTKIGWRWIAWSYKAILDENNSIKEIIGVGRDTTYQKGVEEALRISEDRFRSIVQQSSDIMFIIRQDTYILYDTPSITKVLGYEENFLIKKFLKEIIYPDDFKLMYEKISETITSINASFSIEIRMQHAKGKWVFVEAVGINMLDHPSINGLVITCRNISERKQIEKKILDTIMQTEERERERFAKNLHDDVGPLLSSIKMYINSFGTTYDKRKQSYIIKQLNEVVKEAITTTKEISNDLSPHILINYGLIAAIESFIRNLPEVVKINLIQNINDTRYQNIIENSMYRIIKELINNTLKHANAKKSTIVLNELDSYLILNYSDNGKGIDLQNPNEMQYNGMGLSNITSRTKSLNGLYDISSEPGKGFLIVIKIPIDQGHE